MKLLKRVSMLVLGSLALVALSGQVVAHGKNRPTIVRAWLTGYEELPSTLSSPGHGFFRAIVDEDAGTIQYWLTYSDIPITQSHLHFGAHHVAGGISVFLCTNLGNAPAGQVVQACPGPTSGQITGTITAANVIGPLGQGVAAGEFAELVAAIHANAVYVNIHTVAFPIGEIRGQLN
jgi:hypothetical protein